MGLLLLLPPAGAQTGKAAAEIAKALAGKYKVESAVAPDTRDLQKAVDRLQAAKASKIIVVPLLENSHSVLMDQNRFLLGIRKEPSSDYLWRGKPPSGGAPIKRLKISVPMALTPALDDHPVMVEILAQNAKSEGRDPARENLILVVAAPKADADNSQWKGTFQLLADKVGAEGKFKSVKLVVLREDVPQQEREKDDRVLKGAAKPGGRGEKIIILPVTMRAGSPDRRFARALNGAFAKISSKAVFPHPRLTYWTEQMAEKGSLLPDMRMFKEDGGKRLSAPFVTRPPSVEVSAERPRANLPPPDTEIEPVPQEKTP